MVRAKKPRRWIWLVLILLLAAGGGSYPFWAKREQIIIIQTEPATRRNITEVVVANGRIQPVLQVVINPEVSGEIVELPVKEGQRVQKGELLVKIKPDNYIAGRNVAEANYNSSLAGRNLAQANLTKAELEFKRNETLFQQKLISDSQFLEAKTLLEVAKASFETSGHQADQAKAALAKANDDLAKTIIHSPMSGTITKLRSQVGERVVGTALMAGTEIMTVSDLEAMEARVDISEMDILLIATGQVARLEVDAFREKKFAGIVTEIANSSKSDAPRSQSGSSGGSMSGGQSQEATKFEVRIRVQDKEFFRPGMSVTAEIETRYRTNVLAAPIQSVTTRLPKKEKKVASAPAPSPISQAHAAEPKGKPEKANEAPKPIEVVFIQHGEEVKMLPVKRGISDDNYVEITEGLQEGQEIVSGGYKAINRELEDGKRVKKGEPTPEEKPK